MMDAEERRLEILLDILCFVFYPLLLVWELWPMYRDTEQAYRSWTLDVYEGNRVWHVDFWYSGLFGSFRLSRHRRKEAVTAAKEWIDAIEIERRKQERKQREANIRTNQA